MCNCVTTEFVDYMYSGGTHTRVVCVTIKRVNLFHIFTLLFAVRWIFSKCFFQSDSARRYTVSQCVLYVIIRIWCSKLCNNIT